MSYHHNVHTPVLAQSINDFLLSSYANVFDGTLGGGGHTQAFLQKGLQVFACDLDESAIDLVHLNTPKNLLPNLHTTHNSFDNAISLYDDQFFDCILLDLGFSSNQLELSGRGFSYQNVDEILDLRYNKDENHPAYHKIFHASQKELKDVLFRYAGETLASPIAQTIEKIKKDKGILTVNDIRQAVIDSLPQAFVRKQNAILSRVWQALRIWTNNEFYKLEKFLLHAPKKLAKNGVLMIISFHSLEDKMVTKTMRTMARPQVIDEFGNTTKHFELLTPHAIIPTEQEIENNPRSRSALLRVIKKL